MCVQLFPIQLVLVLPSTALPDTPPNSVDDWEVGLPRAKFVGCAVGAEINEILILTHLGLSAMINQSTNIFYYFFSL